MGGRGGTGQGGGDAGAEFGRRHGGSYGPRAKWRGLQWSKSGSRETAVGRGGARSRGPLVPREGAEATGTPSLAQLWGADERILALPPPPQLGAVSMHAFLPQWVSFSCGIRVGSAGQMAPRPAPPPSPEWQHTVCSYTETCTDRRPRAAFTSKPLFRGRTTQLTRREGEGKFHFHAPWRPELHAPQEMSCSRQEDEQCGSSDLPASTCGCASVAGSLGPAPSCSRWGDGGPRGSGSGESPWFPFQLCSGRRAASGAGGLARAGEMGRAASQGAHLRTRVGRVPHPVPCGRCPAPMSPLPADVPGLQHAASPTRPGRTSGAGREGCGGRPLTDPLAACVPFPFTAPVAAAVKSSGP